MLDAKVIGARIRSLRINTGLSQNALGRTIKTNGGLVSLWETGKRIPSLRSRAKLAQHFKVTIEFISGDDSVRVAEVRQRALVKTQQILQGENTSAAELNAANNVISRAATDAEKAASEHEAHIRHLMKGAHERVLRKLSRLRSQLGKVEGVS